MPDHSGEAYRTPQQLSLRERVANALGLVLRGDAPVAAMEFCAAVAGHTALAFLLVKSGSADDLEEAVLMGQDIGTLFVGCEHNEEDGRSMIYCRSAFGGSVQETMIEVATDEPTTFSKIDTRVNRFLVSLEIELQRHDVLTKRAYPVSDMEEKDGTPQERKRLFGWTWQIRKGVALAAILAAIASATYLAVPFVHHAKSPPRMVAVQESVGLMPAVAPSSPAPQGIGGVTVTVGGYAGSNGPNLQAFGIHPGAEVAPQGGN